MSSDAFGPELESFLEFIEWPLLREQLAGRTASSPASFRARELRPSCDEAAIRAAQRRTADAARLLEGSSVPDFEHVVDVVDLFKRLARAQRGLGARELRWLAQTVQAGLAAREAFVAAPALAELVAPAPDDAAEETAEETAAADAALAAEILAAIGAYGVVNSTASDALGALRDELRGAREQLLSALQALARAPGSLGVLAEPPVDTQQPVPCLRVRPDRVRRVNGPIRGEAKDGALLVEPEQAQAHYNRVRQLEVDEHAEARRIVVALVARVLPRRAAYERLADGCIQADLHLALARHARDLGLSAPALVPGLQVSLRGARHPLLGRDDAVPIDLEVGGAHRMLVISGPNGGGKTAAMKTLGIAAALAQSGGFVPAAPGSGLPVFTRLIAVAAPRSSVTAGVSQFQAHARDLAAALEAVRPGALLLLDEVGNGTDPGEAAALAQAVLEHLLAREVLTLSTTHLAQLKGFATRTEGVVNASVQLDDRGLPTFVITVGRAGRSFALEAARAAGLPAALCERAERLHADGGGA
jgi:DNA mismatch repair protein MutS2